ncbi:MAG: aspartate-semialdehyde dehydrogenase [Methanosarcinales archaeon]|jgi:aspartate-semialdehyde dehydrogenase|nr:aspartate-semialdehyde dehydrogenase [Methanosarcinales archaeon]
MTETIKVGILGATGAVGQRFIQALENHPWFEITSLSASSRSAGKAYKDAANWRLDTKLPESIAEQTIVEVNPSKVDADIVFSALPSDHAITVEAEFAKNGFVVASNAGAYRMEEDIPLVIPEVNADHLGLIEVQKDNRGWDGYIITNPNCSAIMMALTLKPLMPFGLKSVTVATMQAISGAGYDGVSSMAILDNVVPFIGEEEEKLETEPLKILGKFDGEKINYADIEISASCTRVPVMDGHTESIWADMDSNPTPSEIRDAFLNFNPNLGNLPTEPKDAIVVHDELDRPQPRLDRLLGNGMSVSVGRIRAGKGIQYVAMGHNTIRGAAGASVLNAELLKSLKKL